GGSDGDVNVALARFAVRLADERFQELMRTLVDKRVDIGAYLRRYADVLELQRAVDCRHGVQGQAPETIRNCLLAVDWGALARAAETLTHYNSSSDHRLADRIRAACAMSAPDAQFGALCNVFVKDDGELRRDAPTKKVRAGEPWLDRLFSDAGEQGRILHAL